MLKEGFFKYIGGKDRKPDTLFNTGLAWEKDEILPVDAEFVPGFYKHPTVWQLVTEDGKPITDPDILKKDYGIRVRPKPVEAKAEPPPDVAAAGTDRIEESPPTKKKAAKKASG